MAELRGKPAALYLGVNVNVNKCKGEFYTPKQQKMFLSTWV
jgi:hypothetical protein